MGPLTKGVQSGLSSQVSSLVQCRKEAMIKISTMFEGMLTGVIVSIVGRG